MTTLSNENREIVVLTDAEIELIRIKREEEALTKAKEDAERKLRHEKEIESKKKAIVEEKAMGEVQVAATWEFFKKFPHGQWNFIIQDINDEKKVGDAWSEKFVKRNARIESSDTKYKVYVNRHKVYSSSWSRVPKDLGWKMTVNGPGIDYAYSNKHLKSVDTLLKKVKECRDAADYKARTEMQAKDRDAQCGEVLKRQFMDADIKKDMDSNYSSRSRTSEFRQWVVYHVTLKNGIRFKATPAINRENEVTYTVSEIKAPEGMLGSTFVNVLDRLDFNQVK